MDAITGLARILGDRSRVAILDVLLDGEAHAIGELARRSRISAATASSHIRKLVDAELIAIEPRGRERLVRIHAPAAELMEKLAEVSALERPRKDELRFARTCYDHLAGVLGVLVTSALVARGWLHPTSDNLEPSPALLAWLHVDTTGPRPLSRRCVDWTERVPHVAGKVGAALCRRAMTERWLVRVRDTRALRVTDRGRVALARELGLTLPQRA